VNEVRECRSEYPNSYIRVIGFDNIKQCQMVSFIVYRPNTTGGRF
ncbi:MAG: ribulose bisphosphate carboxylase small subunit, partial [Cyanobacteria bacterium J06641_5]